jgi:hypothetical protein
MIRVAIYRTTPAGMVEIASYEAVDESNAEGWIRGYAMALGAGTYAYSEIDDGIMSWGDIEV